MSKLGSSFAWEFLTAVRGPLLVSAFVLSYMIAEANGVAPTPEQLSTALLQFFKRHGVLVIAPICFLESFSPLNSWFPGALVILTAMASTSGNPSAATYMFLVIWSSSLLGLAASFLTGRILGDRSESSQRPRSDGQSPIKNAIISAIVFAHPYTGSLHVFRAGIQNERLMRAAPPILLAHFFWSLFWAVTTYRYGLWLYEGNTLFILIWGYLIAWFSIEALKYVREK